MADGCHHLPPTVSLGSKKELEEDIDDGLARSVRSYTVYWLDEDQMSRGEVVL